MWNKPWTIREGLAIGGGLIIIGQLLQCFTGGIDWQLFAFPANLITLGFYLLSLGVLYIFRKRLYVVQYFLIRQNEMYRFCKTKCDFFV